MNLPSRHSIYRLTLSAMLFAMGMVLPFLTGQIPEIGKMLLPMHIPVLLCGMICGPLWGCGVGFALPLCRSLLFGMPYLYPNACSMAMELAAYGLLAGLLFVLLKGQRGLIRIYGAMLPAMIGGRVIWGLAQLLLLGLEDMPFGWQMFLSGAVLTAIPGIILQLILIPLVMSLLLRYRLLPWEGKA